MLINKARFARPCVEPIGRLKTTFHRAQRGVYSSRMCVYLLFPFPRHYVVCMVLFPFPKHFVVCMVLFPSPKHFVVCMVLFPFPKHFVVCMVLFPSPKHFVVCMVLFPFPKHFVVCMVLFPFPKHFVVCMVLFPFPKHFVERRECEGTFRFPHYLICPNVIQFLHIGVHSKVPHTIEQHAKIQGTSSSGGIEQAQIKHIK